MRTVSGTSVLVTGGGSGIGAGTAAHLVGLGARVTITGRRAEKVQALADSLGPACRAVAADVDSPAGRRLMVDAALEHGGGLDLLVHSAGNMYRGSLAELDEDELLALYRTNVVAATMLTQLALPALIEQQGGVVFFGSGHVQRAIPGASPYAGTKAALETVTGTLAAELGPRGVRVNCVRPGSIPSEINQRAGVFDADTDQQRREDMVSEQALDRLGTVEDIAEAVTFLATSTFTTGAVVTVDGGFGLGMLRA